MITSIPANHVQPKPSVSSPPTGAESDGAKRPHSKISLGRTQSAQPFVASPSPNTASNSTTTTTSTAEARSEISPGFSISRSYSSATNNTASPSRESREKAEEVARQVVSAWSPSVIIIVV